MFVSLKWLSFPFLLHNRTGSQVFSHFHIAETSVLVIELKMAGYRVQEGHNCHPKDEDWNGPEPRKLVTAGNNYWERLSEYVEKWQYAQKQYHVTCNKKFKYRTPVAIIAVKFICISDMMLITCWTSSVIWHTSFYILVLCHKSLEIASGMLQYLIHIILVRIKPCSNFSDIATSFIKQAIVGVVYTEWMCKDLS